MFAILKICQTNEVQCKTYVKIKNWCNIFLRSCETSQTCLFVCWFQVLSFICSSVRAGEGIFCNWIKKTFVQWSAEWRIEQLMGKSILNELFMSFMVNEEFWCRCMRIQCSVWMGGGGSGEWGMLPNVPQESQGWLRGFVFHSLPLKESWNLSWLQNVACHFRFYFVMPRNLIPFLVSWGMWNNHHPFPVKQEGQTGIQAEHNVKGILNSAAFLYTLLLPFPFLAVPWWLKQVECAPRFSLRSPWEAAAGRAHRLCDRERLCSHREPAERPWPFQGGEKLPLCPAQKGGGDVIGNKKGIASFEWLLIIQLSFVV